MTVGTAKQLTAVLDSWVDQGIKENPLGSNKTPIGEEFGWNGVAWCCETMSVAQTRIGLHCFHEAAVVNAVAKAKRGVNGLKWIDRNGVIAEGDMPCFEWADGSHHISYVRDPGTQVKFETDSGNEHDRMYRQWRDRKYVLGFIRLPYATTNQGDDDMTGDEHDALFDCRTMLRQLSSVSSGFIEVILREIKAAVESDDHGGPGHISAADIDAIAKRELDLAAARLAS